MANNRLFLRCRLCGNEVTIARYSAGGEHWEPSRVPPDEYAAWLEAHTQCGQLRGEVGVLHVEMTSENEFMLDMRRESAHIDRHS